MLKQLFDYNEQFLTIIQIILTVSEEAEKTGIGLTQDKQWYG